MSTTTAAPDTPPGPAVTGAAGVASVLLSGPSAEATPTAAAAEKAIPTFCAMCALAPAAEFSPCTDGKLWESKAARRAAQPR